MISIIIPYHNNIIGIKRLLESIPNDPFVEVVIINDHSPSILELVQGSHIDNVIYFELLEHERWAGAARNKGLALSSGEFVLFADSDDFFIDGFLSIIKTYTYKNLDVIYFKPESQFEDGRPSHRADKYIELIERYKKDPIPVRYEFFVPWSKLIKRSFINEYQIKFDQVIASNDVMFSLKVGHYASTVDVSDDTIYCVVEGEATLTKILSKEVIQSRFDVFCRYNEFISNNCRNVNQISSISCLSRSLKVSFKFFLTTLKIVIKNNYPILPDSHGIKRWLIKRRL
mgnify:CR=1 FL=1